MVPTHLLNFFWVGAGDVAVVFTPTEELTVSAFLVETKDVSALTSEQMNVSALVIETIDVASLSPALDPLAITVFYLNTLTAPALEGFTASQLEVYAGEI